MKKVTLIAALLLSANFVLANELFSKMDRSCSEHAVTEAAVNNQYAAQQAAQDLAQAQSENQF
ncbi:hypothetical protein QE250_03450 [Chromatiaceae bacterium AAb-1]|jgi:hypothetical protein|nr:hypothetical protein [Chromatiaceae bacterium AAb-1]